MKAFIDHELCHVVTIPTMEMPIAAFPEPGERLVVQEYVDLFREYLAEKEFVRRYPRRKVYLQTKRRALVSPPAFKELSLDSVPELLIALFRVFYDSIYFHLTGDPTFRKWCQEVGNSAYFQLFQYVMEDFDCLDLEAIDYLEKLQLVNHSAITVMILVDLESLQEGQVALRHGLGGWPVDQRVRTLWESRSIPTIRSGSGCPPPSPGNRHKESNIIWSEKE